MNFEIISRNEYRIVFYDQEFDKKGWMSRYTVKLECPVMSGYVLVENPPYGHSPLSLYKSIQDEWRGWDGEKSWGSIEGEFDLTAVSDRTGHITLSARIRTRFSEPSSELEMDYIIEAGQMDQIVRRAEKFFKI